MYEVKLINESFITVGDKGKHVNIPEGYKYVHDRNRSITMDMLVLDVGRMKFVHPDFDAIEFKKL